MTKRIRVLNVSSEYIDQAKSGQIEEIKQRHSLYRSNSSKDNSSSIYNIIIKGKTAVLADDGASSAQHS